MAHMLLPANLLFHLSQKGSLDPASLVLHITNTAGFHLAILFLSALIFLFHLEGRIRVPFIKTALVLM